MKNNVLSLTYKNIVSNKYYYILDLNNQSIEKRKIISVLIKKYSLDGDIILKCFLNQVYWTSIRIKKNNSNDLLDLTRFGINFQNKLFETKEIAEDAFNRHNKIWENTLKLRYEGRLLRHRKYLQELSLKCVVYHFLKNKE